jgi:hypothetical protein
LHGTLVLVVEPGVVVDVVLVVEVVLLEDVVLVEVGLVDVLVVTDPGGPSWQWFTSPWPQPGRHDIEELVVSCGLPWTAGPPEMAHADPPESTAAAATPATNLSARSLPIMTWSFSMSVSRRALCHVTTDSAKPGWDRDERHTRT